MSSRWLSSLYYPMRNSDQMIIGKTHPTLFFRAQESNKNFSKNRFLSIFNVKTKLEILVRQFLDQNILWLIKILISSPNFSKLKFMAVLRCKRMNQNEHNLNHYKNLLVRWLISIWRHQKKTTLPRKRVIRNPSDIIRTPLMWISSVLCLIETLWERNSNKKKY